MLRAILLPMVLVCLNINKTFVTLKCCGFSVNKTICLLFFFYYAVDVNNCLMS